MGADDRFPVDSSSDAYKEFARLYRIVQEMHPGGANLWNERLVARTDDKWGGLNREGTMSLNERLVLRHLTGGELSDDPQCQSQALATVLHESQHARARVDAAHEPNAVRTPESLGLDEGFAELSTIYDFDEFAHRSGYDGVGRPEPEYAGAVLASQRLLERATSSQTERTQLLASAMNMPVVMRWDAVADHIVRNELADVVPPDPEHQQAARAHLVNQMATPEWAGVQNRPNAGPLAADLTTAGVDRAVGQLRVHYEQRSGEPYPAKVPNPQAARAAQAEPDRQQDSEQERASTSPGLGTSPAPAAETRVNLASGATIDTGASRSPQARTIADRGARDDPMRFLGGQAPAAEATHRKPSLGDGARGADRAAPLTGPHRSTTPTDRGRG